MANVTRLPNSAVATTATPTASSRRTGNDSENPWATAITARPTLVATIAANAMRRPVGMATRRSSRHRP